ncbi:cysteine hydrolase family protein [Pseudonocardia sp. TRM90224]|uniref:cysteine hydrolase family protein n=1 Tax=Pseudonocardia sp. TRM90224 TaxID=2812678 RepID=UPI001E5B2826|nr:cysteine hydrolase [Pseudonocardia sp. TRM90224]
MNRHLAVIDMQVVFANPASPWATPRFAQIVPRVQQLVESMAPRVTFTRFVPPPVPHGSWQTYYDRWPFALTSPDAELYDVVTDLAPGTSHVVTATTFSKWGHELAAAVGDGTLVLAGVSTDCCVLSTALAAADAGVPVQVVEDVCAGVDDASHAKAIDILRLYAPMIDVVRSGTLIA